MNTAVVMALTGVVFNAGYDLINRKASIINRKSGTWTFYLMASVSSCIVALLLNVLTKGMNGFSIGRPDLLYGVIIGIISSITFILYLKSFSGDNTSTSVTIFRMNMIPSIIFAVLFLGETISLRRGIAIIVCIISVLMLNSWKFGKLPDMRYLLPSLGAFLFGGILNFVNKLAVTAGCNSFSLLFIRFLVVTIIAGAYMTIRKSFHFDRKVIKYAVGSGTVIIGAIYFILEGLKRGDIALVLPITQLSFILVVIISWLFFKEKMNTVKIIGIFLAIGSILLIN